MSFSVPRCRRPICGSTRSTTSPSSSSTRRRTPWAAGCCGPKFTVKLRNCGSAIDCLPRHRHSRPLIVETCVELVPRHDEALVTAFADCVHSVVCLDRKGDARPIDGDTLGFHCHGQPRRSRGRVTHIDVHAEAAFARIEVGSEELHAVPLHQAYHEAGGKHRGHGLEIGHLGIEVRDRLFLRHPISETIAQSALERGLHCEGSFAPVAFSSPGSGYPGPSHGERKSKLRNSCVSRTGSEVTRFCSSS